MDPHQRTVIGLISVLFLGASAFLGTVVDVHRSTDPWVVVLLVLLYASLVRVSFEVGSVNTHPEQLAFIPLLFLAPLHLVPLLVAAGFLISRVPDFVLRHTHPDRWIWSFSDAWPAVGPALVLALFAPGPVSASHAFVYVLAFGAQALLSMAALVFYGRLSGELKATEALQMAGAALRIDAVLTPIAYTVAVVAAHQPLMALSPLPLAWLLRRFSQERRERLAAALELNQAYRGTVMVLSDVVESEDRYTADHCRSVVELVAAVAEQLKIAWRERQELEIAALLHDVGKIAIPNEILNKPSSLTDDEFELMKSHTVEGEALLARVGGRLAKVGTIVRSCHERWDGGGYPDGLAGEEIPLAARIVFCCDAYSAMTTNRPYRTAMSSESALEEIARNAGTQFDPEVAVALTEVMRADQALAPEYSDAVRAVLAGQSVPAQLEPA
jgi:HD-GYP domain-containing protein (c-di-GMP phosphodiesterase class II)